MFGLRDLSWTRKTYGTAGKIGQALATGEWCCDNTEDGKEIVSHNDELLVLQIPIVLVRTEQPNAWMNPQLMKTKRRLNA